MSDYYDEMSHQRVKRILQEDYGINLVRVRGYKINRYQPFNLYNAVDEETGRVIMKGVTLKALRQFLKSKGYH